MTYVQASYSIYAWMYFESCSFIGAFFLMKLTLAVIETKYSSEHEKKKDMQELMKKKNMGKKGLVLDFDNLNEEEKQKLILG